MHSNIRDRKRGKGTFDLEFLILSVAFPVNPAIVDNTLGNVNYRKTPISQNAQGMGDSRWSQSQPEKPLNIKPRCWESYWKGLCGVSFLKHSWLQMWFNASLRGAGQAGPQAKRSGPRFPLSRQHERRLGRICHWSQDVFLKFFKYVPWILLLFPCIGGKKKSATLGVLPI